MYRLEVVNCGGAKIQQGLGRKIFMINVMKSTTKTVMAILLLTAAPAVAISVSATPAFAEKGGNSSRGKSNESRGNRDARPSRRDAESTEDSVNHGAIASELKGLNAAHASPNGVSRCV